MPDPDLPSTPAARVAAGVAVLLGLATVAALIGAGWLDSMAQQTGPAVRLAAGVGWPAALNGVILAALAATILLHQLRQRLGWLMLLLGVFWALDGVTQSYVRAGLTERTAWPAMTAALWFYNRAGAFLPVAIAALLLYFPTGRLLPGRWGVAGRVALSALVTSGSLVLVAPAGAQFGNLTVPPTVDLDPTSIPALDSVPEFLPMGIGIVGFLVTLLLVAVRYRRSDGVLRDRIRWLLWGVVAIAVALVASVAVHLPGLDYVVVFVVMVLPAGAMTVAVVRPAVVPVQDLLARTIVLAIVVAVLVAADTVMLAVLTLALDDTLTQAQVVAVVLAVTVLLYSPLRLRLSALVRRMALGQRGNRYDAVAGLASTLETTDDTAEQLAVVARAVARAFGVRFVSVEVDRSHGECLVTTYGQRPDRVRTLPITYRGTAAGRLVLPARGLRSRLSAADERLLGDLVRQAATAARTGQLAEEVQRSRERLVAAREEERRRIRRDLHDGLGPSLSGVVFELEAARLAVPADPAGATARLGAISEHVQGVVADVRRLVHDLRPPALDDRGLVGALRQQADRLELPLEVVAPELDGRLPAAVEVAAYRIVGEALTNVVRHARATSARLELRLDDDALVVELADDGIGIDPDRQAGVGLLALRERAAELGGDAEITCPAGGGTLVHARLPLTRRRVDA